MKHHFLTACAIAIGSLATGATGAFAQTPVLGVDDISTGDSADVLFTNADELGVISFCLALPVPGTLGQSSATSTTLSSAEANGGSNGQVVLTCNVPPTLSVDNSAISQEEGTGTTGNFTGEARLSPAEPGAGVGKIVEVDLDATTSEGFIASGVYNFKVPVTVTYN